jgi:hypothetical protein
MKKSVITEIIAALFILLFIYAAASKLLDYQKFKIQLGQSPLLTIFATQIAWTIPLIEIFISLLLSFKKTKMIGLFASFYIMVLFTMYIIIITRFSDYIPCSCGGILQHMTWNQHLFFNIIFIVLAATAIVSYQAGPGHTLKIQSSRQG